MLIPREAARATEGLLEKPSVLRDLAGQVERLLPDWMRSQPKLAGGTEPVFGGTPEQVREAWQHMNAVPIAPHDVVSSTDRMIGSSQFTAKEGLARLHFMPSSGTSDEAADLFRMDEMPALIKSGRAQSEPVPALGHGDRPLQLSLAGSKLYTADAALTRLASSLSQGIKDNRWSTIIGDDVSGRLPALFTSDQMQRWAVHRNIMPPDLLFMAGGRAGLEKYRYADRTPDLLRRFDQEGDAVKKGRALIVTDMITTGNGMEGMFTALNRHGIKYDVATLGVNDIELLKREKGLPQDSTVFHANSGFALYAGGPHGNRLRPAIGVEKYGTEATVRKREPEKSDQHSIDLLRKELYALSRHTFERVFQ